MKRAVILAASIFLLVFLATPFVSIILPQKLRDHAYREFMMHVIARRQTRAIIGQSAGARRIFYFCAKNTFLSPGDLLPYDDKALGYLVNGSVFCDYVADIMACLCAHIGIEARYCMLMDKEGISPHTVTEVLLEGKWRVFDPAEINYYTAKDATVATIEDLSGDPGLVYESKRQRKLRELMPAEYDAKRAWYARMIPVRHPPQRSKSKTKRITVFDKVGIAYYDLLGEGFLRIYQDAYLKKKAASMPPKDALYYRARNYQLSGRQEEAIILFNRLIDTTAGLDGAEKARLYLSFIYADDTGDARKAIAVLEPLAEAPGNVYAKYASYYIADNYRALGDHAAAKEYFDRSGMRVYLDPDLAN